MNQSVTPSVSAQSNTALPAASVEPSASQPPQMFFRDPRDVQLHRLKDLVLLLALLALLVSLGVNLFLYIRKPELIVAVTTPDGQRVVRLNNRDYGATDALTVAPDKLTPGDKTYLAAQFAKALYEIDPASRAKDLARGLRMMVPASAINYTNFLKQDGILEVQRRENWQTVWREQSVKLDENDPYLVHLIGTQEITKTVGATPLIETVQYALDIKLVADLPRSDRNLRTGFLVASFKGDELSRANGGDQPGSNSAP